MKNSKKDFYFKCDYKKSDYPLLVDKLHKIKLISNKQLFSEFTFRYRVASTPLLNNLKFVSSLKIIKSDVNYNYNLLKLIDHRNYTNNVCLVGSDFAYFKYQFNTFISIFFSKVAPTTLLKSLIDFEYYIKKILYTRRLDFFKVLPIEYARIVTLFR